MIQRKLGIDDFFCKPTRLEPKICNEFKHKQNMLCIMYHSIGKTNSETRTLGLR